MENNTIKTFKVMKNRAVRIVTLCVWLAAIAACTALIVESFGDVTNFYFSVPVTAAVSGLLLYYFFLSPRRVELTADAVVVSRVLGHKAFRYSDIADVGVWEQGSSGLLRVWGSGLFCGFIGWFAGGGLGRHFEYVGRYDQAFYLKLRSGRTYLLSCEDRDEVVRYIRKMKNEE